MEIIVYADESGTFDQVHNDYFVFGGVLYLNREHRDAASRKYIHAEKCLREDKYKGIKELKACLLSNSDKGKLYRSLNNTIKFGVIIDQKKVLKQTFNNKKSKQRYLDYAFKIGLKRCLQRLSSEGVICVDDVEEISVFFDEHTTATNGRYELREGLEQEFKYGTFNYNYNVFYDPLFPGIKAVNLDYCNSDKKTLIRAADIVANKLYYSAVSGNKIDERKIYVTRLP